MGIKEHFKEHPDEDIKIHDFSVEAEEVEKLKFDAESEISGEVWRKLKDSLERCRENSWIGFDEKAFALKILFPDRASELGLNDDAWQGMNTKLEKERENNHLNFVEQAMRLKILFPERISELDLDSVQQIIEDELIIWRHSDREVVIILALSSKIIFPEKTLEFDFDDEDWREIKEKLEDYRDNEQWLLFAQQAMRLKILFPERISELGLDDKTWKIMKDLLKNYCKDKRWGSITNLAMYLKVLAADEVKVTDQGLELVMRKQDFKQERKPRPERREF